MANTQNEEQQELDQVEMLESSIGKTEKFIEKNQDRILMVIAAVVLVVVGFWAYNKFIKTPKEIDAATQMHQAEIYLEMDSINQALNGDANYPGFLDIINKYSGTDASNNAKYYAGVCYMRLGEYDQAIKMLEGFSTSDPMLEPISIGLTGDGYMEKGDTKKAISLYKNAVDKAKGNILAAPLYLKKLGTAYEKEQNYKDALNAYETIKAEYPTSNEGRDADKYIQSVKIKLGK